MRIFNKYAYLSAVALVGAVGFTACSSDDELTAEPNPTFDGESVKTQFTINVPAGGSSTRLSEDIVQGQSPVQFRGMDNIYMFAFNKVNGSEVASIESTDAPIRLYDNMGSILNNELLENTNAKVYYDIEIPTGVNRFLFYGEATHAEGATNVDNGSLKATYPTSTSDPISNIRFELEQIATGANIDTETKLLSALNGVAKATDGTTAWSATTNNNLKSLYLSFIQLKAGSANSIKEALASLKEGVNGITDVDIDNLKSAIIAEIENAIGSDGNGGTLAGLTYPRDLGLPDGSVQVYWDGDDSQFKYAAASDNVWGMATQAKITDYVYPAALYYWTNSTIKVSNETESNNYAGQASWSNVLDNLYTDGTTVVETTRSVAMVDEINYGVARLDLSAWFNAQSGTVKDNISADVDVTTDAGGMQLVGLLVGGQKNVQYDFSTPVDDAVEQSIYDKSITPVNLSESQNSNIIAQTLVLETAAASESVTGKVRFALELQNNTGNAFVGHDGTVPAGGRFYLVGELEPSTEETYKNMDGKVFKQDFTTTAKVTISSLAHAYNCIPDLKEPKLELGLSVNLDWQKGLVDNVTID